MSQPFDFEDAFSRNLGWVTPDEQQILRGKRVAVAGMGGVGGIELITLARLGIAGFNIADFDIFEVANFNRQYGATMSSVGRAKVEVMRERVLDVNPEAGIKVFEAGVTDENAGDFLDGVDLFVDALDIYALDIRRTIFARCQEKGIPAVTAAPIGIGTACLVFMPGKMSFDEYFDFEGSSSVDQTIKLIIGVSPSFQQRRYLVYPEGLDFTEKRAPSTAMGVELAAGVACANVLKILLGRGKIIVAPRGVQFDAYQNRMIKFWRPGGNRNPLQRLLFRAVKRSFAAKS
jgi:molybdopterin/thiamine biosynthesis adenylyltransferase